MQIIGDLGSATRVLADTNTCYVYDESDIPKMLADLNKYFGLKITEEIIDQIADRRKDLFHGFINRQSGEVLMQGDGTMLDCHTSIALKDAINLLGGLCCIQVWRWVEGKLKYVWRTEAKDLASGEPDVWYHGTSDLNLESIREKGLVTGNDRRWDHSPRNQIFLTATPQIAAFHAHRSAARDGALPIVVAVAARDTFECDHDVLRDLVRNLEVPSNDERALTLEAGLFAYAQNIEPDDVMAIVRPNPDRPYNEWERID